MKCGNCQHSKGIFFISKENPLNGHFVANLVGVKTMRSADFSKITAALMSLATLLSETTNPNCRLRQWSDS